MPILTPIGFALSKAQIDKIDALGSTYSKTTDPTVTDDITQGYNVWDKWRNTEVSPTKAFYCLDNTEGAAVWIELGGGGGDSTSQYYNGLFNPEHWTLSYDQGTQTITLVVSEETSISANATVITIEADTYTNTHANTTGLYYLIIDSEGNRRFDSIFDFLTETIIAYVYYNATTGQGILFDERHPANPGWPPSLHRHFHQTVGSVIVSGGAITGIVEDDNDNASMQFSISSLVFDDESLRITLDELIGGDGKYTIFYRSGNDADNEWSYSTGNNLPVSVVNDNPQFNELNTGVWGLTEISSNNTWVNYYLIGTNAVETNLQYLLIPGQNTHSSLGDAESEDFLGSISFGDLPIAEIVPLAKISFRRATGTGNNFYIEEWVNIRGTQANLSVTTIPSSHNSLSDRDASGSHPSTAISHGTESTVYDEIETDKTNLTNHINTHPVPTDRDIRNDPAGAASTVQGNLDTHTSNTTDAHGIDGKVDKLQAAFTGATTLTIATEAITVTQSLHLVDGTDATLATISGGVDNQLLLIRAAADASFTITDTGNIVTGGVDLEVNSVSNKYVFLVYDPTLSKWVVASAALTPEQELILMAHASRHYADNDDELFNQGLNDFDDVTFNSVKVGNGILAVDTEYPVFEIEDLNADVVVKGVAEFDDLTDGSQNGTLTFYVMRNGTIIKVADYDKLLLETAEKTDDYMLNLVDWNKIVLMNKTGAATLTVPSEAQVAFEVGSIVGAYNISADAVTIKGQNAYYSGIPTGASGTVTIVADNEGSGVTATITGDGTSDVDTLVGAFNTANPGNTVSVSVGGTEVPDNAVSMVLENGVTVRGAGDLAQYGEVSLRKRATNEWVLVGVVS